MTIHQPEHLPWLGLLSKVRAADLWIVLDSVPFRKNYFQNRNRILLGDDVTWLTVPVHFAAGTRIDEVVVADDGRWTRKYLGRLQDAYGGLPGFGDLSPLITLVENTGGGADLTDLNLAIIEWLFAQFSVTTPWVRSSELGVTGAKTELLVGLCEAAGADTYLSGPSGRDYLDLSRFEEAGVGVTFAEYAQPAYRPMPAGTPPLAAVDAMLHVPARDRPGLLDSGARVAR